MKFSERIGVTPVRTAFQVDSMDQSLRNGLWNAFLVQCLKPIRPARRNGQLDRSWRIIFQPLWTEFLRLPLDNLSITFETASRRLREWFFSAKWADVYDFLEYLAQDQNLPSVSLFVAECNRVMERDRSGFRFVGSEIAAVTNDTEIKAIGDAIETTTTDRLKGAHTHLRTALRHFSDRSAPDYRNSIKESISAVEAVAKAIAGDETTELGTALKRIEAKIGLHGALSKGFSSIYGYTSDGDGIRHALMEESNLDSDDAKFMLVACSAFVNYLVSKANKAGMLR